MKAIKTGFTQHHFMHVYPGLRCHGNVFRELKKRIQNSLMTVRGLPRTILRGKNGAGFTLIELLITVTIMALLVGGGVAAYNNFNENQKLSQGTNYIKGILRKAQSKTSVGEKPSCVSKPPLDPQGRPCTIPPAVSCLPCPCTDGSLDGWRVIFSPEPNGTVGWTTVQCGGQLDANGAAIFQDWNILIELNPSTLPTTPPSPFDDQWDGLQSILFKSLAQGTNLENDLTITVRLKDNPSKTTTIKVSPSGEVQ